VATLETLALNGGPQAVRAEDHRVWPDITDDDRAAVLEVLDRGTLCGPTSPAITALQDDWASYVGAEYCIATNSGTAALHCAAAGCGIEPGDEIIVPAYTFIATAAAVAHQGAIPVFCDIDERTFNIDVDRIEERITPRTTAIMPVHIHGLAADMDRINEIARRHGLAVIEDAAQSHGAEYKGTRTGTLGDCAAFSLNATKNLSGGEGGLFVTNDHDTYTAARRLSIFGEDVPPVKPGEFRSYVSLALGWNYRNQELPSALAHSQLQRLDHYNETARRNAEILSEGLSQLDGITPPYIPDDCVSVFYKYRAMVDPAALGFDGPPTELRDRIVQALRAEGVEAVLWQVVPLPAYPAFRKAAYKPWHPKNAEEPLSEWDPSEYPVASRVLDSSIVLGSERNPLFVQEADLMDRYVEALGKVLQNLDEVLARPFEPVPLR
jgi:perosamine synthetase